MFMTPRGKLPDGVFARSGGLIRCGRGALRRAAGRGCARNVTFRAAALIASITAAVAVPGMAAPAQDSSLDLADRRFTFYRVDAGYLRLDVRTGEVALCSHHAAGWVCALTPQERAALDGEIARLQRENASLKSALLERGIPLPDGVAPDAGPASPPEPVLRPPAAIPPEQPPAAQAPEPPKSGAPNLRLPEQADIDRALALMERVWRHIVEMVASLQRDLQKKT